jgi:hypothetical protein
MTPPRKGKGALQAPIPNLIGAPQNNSRSAIAQQVCGSGIIWRRWSREAARLFAEFWRTADERHLFAFATHVRAMRERGGR